MERLVEELTNGNVTEVKVVLATVVLALAVYQLLLASVAYGKLRTRLLESGLASWTHRASGDAALVLALAVAIACISVYGFEDESGGHTAFGIAVLAVLALKVAAVRIGGALSKLLPYLGVGLFAALGGAWLTSAGAFLGVV